MRELQAAVGQRTSNWLYMKYTYKNRATLSFPQLFPQYVLSDLLFCYAKLHEFLLNCEQRQLPQRLQVKRVGRSTGTQQVFFHFRRSAQHANCQAEVVFSILCSFCFRAHTNTHRYKWQHPDQGQSCRVPLPKPWDTSINWKQKLLCSKRVR